MYDEREYQQRAIADVDSHYRAGGQRVVLAMGTGTGKTVTAGMIIKERAEQGMWTLFIVERIELAYQAVETFEAMGLRVDVVRGEQTFRQADAQVTVASIQSIRTRGIGTPNFIVIDECQILYGEHRDLMKRCIGVPVLGLSATPMRKGLAEWFDGLIRGPSIRWLMDNGHLVDQLHIYCPSQDAMQKAIAGVHTGATKWGTDYKDGELAKAVNNKHLIGDLVSTWQDKASDRQTLCFAASIAHSKAIAEDFREAGIHAEHLDAGTDSQDRRKLINAFRSHDIQILTSVDVLGIGFDVPTASCGIMGRPTLSEMRYIQQAGRILRPAEGKDDAILLDHAGNTIRFGRPQDFVVPDLSDEDHSSTREKKKQVKEVTCKECNYMLEPDQMTCPMCGVDRPTRSSQVTYVDGVLVEYGDIADKDGFTPDDKKSWYLALLWHANHSTKRDGTPYSDGWAKVIYKEKFGNWPPRRWEREHPVMPNDEQRRWIENDRKRKIIAWRKRRGA